MSPSRFTGRPAVSPKTSFPFGIIFSWYDLGCDLNKPSEIMEAMFIFRLCSFSKITAASISVETSDPFAIKVMSGFTVSFTK